MKQILTSLILLIALAIAPRAFGQQLLEYAKFQGPKAGVAALAIAPDGRTVVVAGKDKSVTLWDTNNGKLLTKLDCQELIKSLAISADGQLLATLETNKRVRLWNFPGGSDLAARGWDGQGEPPFIGGAGEIGPMVITPDGRVFVAYQGDSPNKADGAPVNPAAVSLLDVATGKRRLLIRTSPLRGLPGISTRPLAFSPDGKTLAVGAHDAGGGYRVILLDTATGKQIAVLTGVHRDAVVALSADGKTLAATAIDRIPVMFGPDGEVAASIPVHQIHFWDVPTAKLRSTRPAHAGIAVFHADGQTFVAVDGNNAVSVWINHRGWRCLTPEVHADLMKKFDRLKGMKDAIADLEKGILKVRQLDPQIGLIHPPISRAVWIKLAKQQYGIDVVDENTIPLQAEVGGYNDVMMLEIERRFGRDVLDKLHDKVRAEHKEAK